MTSTSRSAYLGLVGRKGTPERVKQVVAETVQWLAQHHSAKEIWAAMIALLVRIEMIEEATEMAQQAIALHPNDNNLNFSFLRFFNDLTMLPINK